MASRSQSLAQAFLNGILSKVGWQIDMINNVSKIKTHGRALMTFETLFAPTKYLYIASSDAMFDESIGTTCIGVVIRRGCLLSFWDPIFFSRH
ncbi:hypothetical protein FH972_010498 [Carpinus fangiana]|uniref:Uncharacterized protein n=1 Tax=Carpinus fangiana TaxID=176857 RepID=A0A660KRA0_9ROSI|nr:hypothetical protein FH972_010498 [Carpinus fangiana]